MYMPIIRSHDDAYTVASAIYEWLQEGQAIDINFIRIRKQGIYLFAVGQAHRCNEGEQPYIACEFADFVLWPERKRINDALRSWSSS